MTQEERVHRLREMLLRRRPASEGQAPLFPQAKTQALLDMLEASQNERTLARVEGAVWALGNYSFADMEAE